MMEMIRKNKGALTGSSFVMLAGILAGLTGGYPMWINGLFVVIQVSLLLLTFYDNRNRQQSSKVMGMLIWIVPVIMLLCNGIDRLIGMGADTDTLFMAVTYYGTGVLFAVIGNYLPKVKPNHTIGIRVVWTMQDEENWNATHRFSGKLWVATGILCMFCGLLGDSMAVLFLYMGIILAAVSISILYSYLFYKKKVQTGEAFRIHYRRRNALLYAVTGICILLFLVWVLRTGNMEVQFQDTGFTIEAEGWSDYTVDYAQIDSISYEASLPGGRDYRTNGFGNLKFSMGHFKNELYGNYIRYTHSSCDSAVVLRADGKTVVLNGADDAATQQIYQQIREHLTEKSGL